MSRWKASMPRYRTAIIIKRNLPNAAAARGTNVQNTARQARVLKRFDKTVLQNSDLPVVSAPANNLVHPGIYANDWLAWWPAPPDQGGGYVIPDPPTIDRPVLPNAEFPILWEAGAVVGSNFWTATISAIFAFVEWTPQTGHEKITGMTKLSVNTARLKMRPEIIRIAGINAINWNVDRLADDTTWKLESIVPSFRRGEFVELVVEQVER